MQFWLSHCSSCLARSAADIVSAVARLLEGRDVTVKMLEEVVVRSETKLGEVEIELEEAEAKVEEQASKLEGAGSIALSWLAVTDVRY
eukprot:1142281-Rhodomonas_salina.1